MEETASHIKEVQEIKFQVAQNAGNIEKLNKAVFGNGVEGMDEIVRNTNREFALFREQFTLYLEQQKEKETEKKEKKQKVDLLLLAAILGFLGNVITIGVNLWIR